MEFAVLAGAPLAQCENLAGGLRLTCENASFSQAPYGLPARMPNAHVGFKKPLETEKLTNEIKNLNHENVKNEELTLMLQTAR
jgi:hypothetical protein